MSPKHLRDQFASQIERDREYRHHAILALYDRQTRVEQTRRKTRDFNGVGFTAPDAPMLSGFAEALLRGEMLSAAAEQTLKHRLPKYRGQFITLMSRPEPAARGRKDVSRTVFRFFPIRAYRGRR